MAENNPPVPPNAQAQAAAAQAADAAQQMGQALANHERVRKSTELPLYFGRKEKDTCDAQLLVDRFEAAGRIAQWQTDTRKCEEFYLLLRDKALHWWKALDEQPGVNKENWTHVKREFLNFYGQRHAARAVCSNFAELSQRSNENVHDYYLRVMEVYQRIKEMRPENMSHTRAQNGTARVYKMEGIDDMGRYFMLQLFLAGLKDDVKQKTMENVPATLGDALTHARSMEVIINDRRARGAITSIRDEQDQVELGWDEIDEVDEVLKRVNALRVKQGKKPFSTNFKTGSGRFSNVVCRYCKIKGHMQSVCRKRLAAKAPCVDEKGAPFKKVNSTQEDHREDRVQQVSLMGYYDSINSVCLN